MASRSMQSPGSRSPARKVRTRPCNVGTRIGRDRTVRALAVMVVRAGMFGGRRGSGRWPTGPVTARCRAGVRSLGSTVGTSGGVAWSSAQVRSANFPRALTPANGPAPSRAATPAGCGRMTAEHAREKLWARPRPGCARSRRGKLWRARSGRSRLQCAAPPSQWIQQLRPDCRPGGRRLPFAGRRNASTAAIAVGTCSHSAQDSPLAAATVQAGAPIG